MKKLFQILGILAIFLFSFQVSFANETEKSWSGIQVKVTEKVPGASCREEPKNSTNTGSTMYICTIQPGFSSIMMMLGNFIKYFTAIASLAGVLFIVINGISLSMGWLDSEAQTRAKDNITRTILWIVLLLFTGVILNAIAPWIFA